MSTEVHLLKSVALLVIVPAAAAAYLLSYCHLAVLCSGPKPSCSPPHVVTRILKLCNLLQASHCVCILAQVSEKFAEGGDKASVSAVDMAKQVADQAVPTADRVNQKIEKQAHELTANAEFHAKDVANEYQKGAKVHPLSVALI